MIVQAEEIIFKTGKTRRPRARPETVCDIFRYQPDNIEQMPLGELFIVAELDKVKDCGYLNNLLASLIKREYYLYPAKGAQKCFQAAISKTNLHLAGLAKEGNLDWLGKLHFFCAAIAEEKLLFSQAGNIKAFLCRQNHFIDLSRKIIPGHEKPHPSKMFNSVVSGSVEPEDKMLFATSAIEEFFSQSGLRQMLISQSKLADISQQINRVLREQQKSIPFAILLLQVKADEPIEKKSPSPKQTARVTTPPIDLKEILK